MRTDKVLAALGAVAHAHRLAVYRMLVQCGPNGLPAGDIAGRLDMPPSSLTFHLQQLRHGGLISQRRLGRQLIYAVDYAAMNGLVAYLTENCCGNAAAPCAPLCKPAAAKAPRPQRRSA